MHQRVKRWIGAKRRMPPACTILTDQEALQAHLFLRQALKEDENLITQSTRDALEKLSNALNSSVIIRIEVDDSI